MRRIIIVFSFIWISILGYSQINDSLKLEKAKNLHEKALDFHKSGNLIEALNPLRQALNLLDTLNMKKTALYAEYRHDLSILYLLGKNDIYRFEKNIQEAIDIYYQVVGESQEYYFSKQCYADGLVMYSRSLGIGDSLDINIALLSNAINVYESIPEYHINKNYISVKNELKIYILYNEIINKYKSENYIESLDLSLQIIQHMDSIGLNNNQIYSDCKHYVGASALVGKNDFEMFENNILEAIDLEYSLTGFSEQYYWYKKCYADGLTRYAKQIDFPQNISINEKAIKIYEAIPQHEVYPNYIESLRNLAVFYKSVNIEKAIALTLKSLQLHRKAKDIKVDSLVTLSNLADYYCDYGNYDKALHYNDIVLNVRESQILPNYDKIRISNLRAASIYRRLNNYEKAIYHSEKSRELALKLYGKESVEYTRSLQNTSVYYLDKGDVVQALEYTKKAYNNSFGDKYDLAHNLATIYSKLNHLDSCYFYAKEAWEISKDLYLKNLQQLSLEDRFHYVCSNRVSLGLTLPRDLLLSHENNEELCRLAYDGILFGKNLIMDCMLGDEAISKLKSINWNSIQSYLDKDEVAIEFWSDKSEDLNTGILIALVLRKEWSSPRVVKISKDKIYRTLNNIEQTTESYLPLYENIWKDIIEVAQLQKGEKVYISLDDILAQIPIESICGYDYNYVGDKYDIVRVTSTRNIPIVREQKTPYEAILYGGLKYDTSPVDIQKESSIHYSSNRSIQENLFELMTDSIVSDLRSTNKYLPWTKEEVDSIYTILSNSKMIKNIRLYEEEKGVEESFKIISGNSPSIIHIATHGVSIQPIELNDMNWVDYYSYCMEHSGLLFSGALNTNVINTDGLKVEDGILRSNEISLLDLSKTDLVVLSACKTGTGGVTPFGLAGLQWAFKAAGVKTLILSLSDVDDAATHMMMVSFYHNLMQGYSKREAFKKVQKALRDSEEFKSFNYWANFVMLD